MDPFTVVSLSGELALTTVGIAEPRLISTIVGHAPPIHLILNMSRVAFMDSAGISLLAKTHFAVRSTRGTLRLVIPDEALPRRMLSVTGVDQSIKVTDTLARALNEGLAELGAR
ncbi:hypothetical protein GCM10010468_44990 [Actinocorallia longicatena]|uniref:Anti-sigma factor antagonist n=2 Tax=Actinocorallia longicatena TaxID=111803 RepID=A0ABP6QGG5_9ACTN